MFGTNKAGEFHHRGSNREIAEHLSLVDLLPTLLDLATDGSPPPAVAPLDGTSLFGTMANGDQLPERAVISEYRSEGVCAASRMVRMGRYKYVYTRGIEAMLFDLDADSDELVNLAGSAEHRDVETSLREAALNGWDPDEIHHSLLASQHQRQFIARVAAKSGRYPNWAFQPYVDESRRFVRGGGSSGATSVKATARFPFVAPVEPDRGAADPAMSR